ncbi:Olfactory receptor 2L5 [Heterocephalus glaber]|uniref:Olfactory receptor 2L5 n=1 Tax=Heterocephalus glaber TaxID=10181 RepID=G5C7Q0_HETGA|nr:Olfactory receptor 2L5 [Heterocephalus glaber]
MVPIFLMALNGNLCVVLLILLDGQLHTPMYYLLSQLSLMDLIYICTTVPMMASGFLFGNKSISFIVCEIQSFFFLTLGASEGLILMSMSYDHHVAICFPLHYPIHMNRRCRSWTINHFFCDVPAMLNLACTDTTGYEHTVFLFAILFPLFPFMVILGSYGKVLLAIHHMCSQEGRKKAYSPCTTHLIVVTFYYAPFAYTYLCPKSLHSPAEDKVLAVFYTFLTPMLNPVIYSLRNKKVLGAL